VIDNGNIAATAPPYLAYTSIADSRRQPAGRAVRRPCSPRAGQLAGQAAEHDDTSRATLLPE